MFGVVGVLFTLGGVRSILADPVARRRVTRARSGSSCCCSRSFGVEVVAGVSSIAAAGTDAPIDVIGNVLAASLLIGIARSWELVGDRDYGITSSLPRSPGTIAISGAPWPVRPMSPRTTPAVRASLLPRPWPRCSATCCPGRSWRPLPPPGPTGPGVPGGPAERPAPGG